MEVVVVVVKVVVVVVVVVVWCGCHWQYLQVMYKILLVTEKKVQQTKESLPIAQEMSLTSLGSHWQQCDTHFLMH